MPVCPFVVQIVVAVGVVAVPSGLIANGFSQVLEEKRNAKHAKRKAAAVLLQSQVHVSSCYPMYSLVADESRKNLLVGLTQSYIRATEGKTAQTAVRRMAALVFHLGGVFETLPSWWVFRVFVYSPCCVLWCMK